ncbi:MAG TPA: rhodanese-like domain-containing protein [Candidatus Thermoplasmatota archaeon]|nr:rhodanese-like domain-containing protein [Candidatus Thermoplasmatota archaeon]
MQLDDDEAPSVDVTEAARRHSAGEVVLLDVREGYELSRAQVEGALHIPMREVPSRLAELPKDKPILVLCHHGGRSQAVADWLGDQGYEAANVEGGINAWSARVDRSIPKY